MNPSINTDYFKENSLNGGIGIDLKSSTLPGQCANEDIPDYNQEFPQLTSMKQNDNTFFSSSSFSFSLDRSGLTNNSIAAEATTTPKLFPANGTDESRRRTLAAHQKSVATRIIEITPDNLFLNNTRSSTHQSARNPSANNSNNAYGSALHKICTRIQKETSTTITFLQKDGIIIITVTGRPENVPSAQARIQDELQHRTKVSVNIPFDYHRFIIGPRGATLKRLEQETLTRIAVPSIEIQSNVIIVSGAKDNVKLCEKKMLDLYHTQLNKGNERLPIPHIYHPWIRHHLVPELQRQLNVTIDLPPPIKQTDEVSIRGEREAVEQAKRQILQFYSNMQGKIVTFQLEIPIEQHRFVLGKKGAGIKEIFDKMDVFVRIPTQEENTPIIQVVGETSRIGDAITMIYKMANALTAVQIKAPHWMHNVVKGERNRNIEILRQSHPHVRIFFRDDHIAIEGPPEDVDPVRGQIQAVIDDLRNNNTTYLEVDIDQQYYKQLIGKNQIRLLEIEEQTGCDIKFPFDESRHVKLMGTKESVDKARQILLERVKKLSNERTTGITIDPQFYPQIIGTKGKNLEEVRTKFHNIQITFPDTNDKSDKVILHGDKEDVEKCTRYLQQKVKDLVSIDFDVNKRLYPILIGKNGSNIQSLREQMPDVRIDIPLPDDTKEHLNIRLTGKKIDIDKARKLFDEHIQKLNVTLENSIEKQVNIASKWHNKFFQNKRQLLNELQQQYNDVLIKLPERKQKSDQVLLRGSKKSIEQVEKRLLELIDTWENVITKEITIPHRHYGYLLAQGGTYIKAIEKDHDIQIKFPQKRTNPNSSNNDTVRLIGRSENIDKAIVILEKMIPTEITIDIPNEHHNALFRHNGEQMNKLIEKYPDVQITFPSFDSKSNSIHLNGQSEQVEGLRKDLMEVYEKYLADVQARSYKLRFIIKSEYRSLIYGARQRTLKELQQKYNVKITMSNTSTVTSAVVPTPNGTQDKTVQYDDQQAAPQDNHPVSTETTTATAANQTVDTEVLIIGYEDKAHACRDEILNIIKRYESTITMEIDIDHRVHARIIGSGGQRLQKIMKDYDVEIKFPNSNNENSSDKVRVVGINKTNIDECIDHLLLLEEDLLNIPNRQTNDSKAPSQNHNRQQEVPSTTNTSKNQQPFKVKNAPWGSSEQNGHYNNRQSNNSNDKDYDSSTKKRTSAPNRNDHDEYPSFKTNLTLITDENLSALPDTTVSNIPVIWGPQKRNRYNETN